MKNYYDGKLHRVVRVLQGRTLKDLAAEAGVPAWNICRAEKGHRPLRPAELIAVARVLVPGWREEVLINDLLDGLELSYKQNGRRSSDTLRWRLEPLRAALGTARAVDIKGAAIEEYKAARLASETRKGKPLAVATCNRELAALRRAFKLGIEQERISGAPVIKLLAEDNTREGFLEPRRFEELASHLPDPINNVARFAYITGWRRAEVLTLQWADVDLEHRRIRLRRANSKNEEPRVIVLTSDLLALIHRRWAARQYQTPAGVALATRVFHRRGKPVKEFRAAWDKALAAAKVPGLILHDFRRSAARNMEKAGVSQAVAMKIMGHKTPSMYRRYLIVDEQAIEQAMELTQVSIRQAASNVTDRKSG